MPVGVRRRKCFAATAVIDGYLRFCKAEKSVRRYDAVADHYADGRSGSGPESAGIAKTADKIAAVFVPVCYDSLVAGF